jgi:hypothetical protein
MGLSSLQVSPTMSTPTPNSTLSSDIFAIPELVYLISGLLGKADQAALLRVCRRLYDCMKPLVWETANDVIALLKLIPGVEVLTFTDDAFPPFTVRLLD